MNPFKFATAICIGSVVTLVSSLCTMQGASSVVIQGTSTLFVPGADTPLFYLVSSSSSDPASNLLPLRLSNSAGGFSTLSGSGPIGKFYFIQGEFVALGSPDRLLGLINGVPLSTGCSTFGQLAFSVSSTNKCALRTSFELQSNTENSQLGAFLVFNFVGSFYECGSGRDVWYFKDPVQIPPGLSCTSIKLYTVPV